MNDKTISNLTDQLKLLCDRKIELLASLIGIENRFNELAPKAHSTEEWLYSLSIESLWDIHQSTLDEDGRPRSRLGDFKKRCKLRKNSVHALNELDQIDSKIKLMKIDLLQAKVGKINEI